MELKRDILYKNGWKEIYNGVYKNRLKEIFSVYWFYNYFFFIVCYFMFLNR